MSSLYEGGGLNPRDFEEFADANTMQRELFFWKVDKIIKKSKDKKFLNKCLRLMTEADHENWMLGQAIAGSASQRLILVDIPKGLFQKVGYEVKRFFRRKV